MKLTQKAFGGLPKKFHLPPGRAVAEPGKASLKMTAKVPMQWRKSAVTDRQNSSRMGSLSTRVDQHKLLSMISQPIQIRRVIHGTFGASISRNWRTHIHHNRTSPRRSPQGKHRVTQSMLTQSSRARRMVATSPQHLEGVRQRYLHCTWTRQAP